MTPHLASQLAAIELAYALPDGHTATETERATLAGFTGWGQLAKAFDPAPEGQWAEIADRLEAAMPTAHLAAARDQVDTSFFTPTLVTDAVWEILRSVGFTGGRAVEPGCGSGAFMTSTPDALDVQWTGIEIDPASARIAGLLHPSAEIITGALQKTPLRDGSYDVAVGNVPFSDVHLYDSEGRGGALHHYFAWRAVDAVRPGGYVVLITSRYAMDSQKGIQKSIREWEGAALVGAVRLPAGAFTEAGTQAVTDIIVIRKNDEHTHLPRYAGKPDFETIDDGYDAWNRTSRKRVVDHRHDVVTPSPAGQEPASTKVSRYWADNPAHVAGTMLATGFDRAPLTVRSDDAGSDVPAAVAALTASLPQMSAHVQDAGLDDVILEDAEGRKEGSFHLIAGNLFRVENGTLNAARNSKELTALVSLRDLALNLLTLEADVDLPDEAIADARAKALDGYETYVRTFGHLNRGTLIEGAVDEESGLPALSWRRPAMGGFRKDPDAAVVMALEVFDQGSGQAVPAPILLGRVNHKPVRATSAGTPAEALAISLGETGAVDLTRIAGLLNLPDEAATVAALGDLIYEVAGVWQPATEALSGNVRQKLVIARAAAARGDQGASRYAAALEKVVPADLGPADINITLGSPFVTPADITDFLKSVLGARWPRVAHTPSQAMWEVEDSSYDQTISMQWSVPDMTAGKLVEHALNNKLPEITDRLWSSAKGDFRNVRNPQKSAAAAAKLELIRDRFSVWVWEDKERADRITSEYNDKLNSHVTRVYDGAGLTFPGMSDVFTPWPHQRAAVERIVSTERALLGHPVGAGKTLEMAAAARTLRQFGLANKPMIVVPNHLLEQIAREAQQAFPTGRFLIATKDDLARDARRLFAARCATGGWDAVIITHQAFGSIPVRPEIEEKWIAEQKHALRWAMQSEPGDRTKGAKAIARAVRSLDVRIQKLREGKNDADAIFFDQLGVDYIMVDEAHLFRRLDTQSQSRDNGMGSGSSKRATDLLVKVETLAERHPGKPIAAFFTGTPWSNTLAETWVWQRYLQPDALDAIGLLPFDAWVSAFIRYEHNIEVSPDGSSFRMYRRPVGVVNAPELKMLLSQVADIMDPAQLGLSRPDYTVQNVTVEASPEQRAFVRDLADRADAIRSGTAREGSTPGAVDNMLLICNDGRKIALDPQLAGLEEKSAKIAKAAEMIADAYHLGADRTFGDHPTPGTFQLAFMDLGTPHPGDSQTYGRLRRQLVERGIPAHKVRFVHDATTDKARSALFASCRDGEVAVLLASTAKAGMGTNIQTRLTHLWHVDAPWLPSEVIQRDGRAVRPGNLSEHVTLTRLVTEGTFDSFMWQALERKSRAFDALYATGATAREIEDVSGATLSYGEVKALASGNPLLLDQAKVRAEVKQLQVMRAMHLQQVNQARTRSADHQRSAESARARANKMLEASQSVTELDPTARAQAAATLAGVVASLWHSQDASSHAHYMSRVGYRGITVKLEARDREHPVSRVTLLDGYASFAEVSLRNADVRRKATTVAETILDLTDKIIADLAERIARATSDVASFIASAAELDRAASGAVFEQQDALEAAVIRLAEIDAAIAEDANQPAAA